MRYLVVLDFVLLGVWIPASGVWLFFYRTTGRTIQGNGEVSSAPAIDRGRWDLPARVSVRCWMKDILVAITFVLLVMGPAILAMDIFERKHY
jgi:hypothetical protein